MSGTFDIVVDPTIGLIRITMAGFYEADDIAAFVAARHAAHARLGWPDHRHMTLNDVRAMKIQDRSIVQAFQEMLSDPAYRSRRLAFVADANLVRGQLLRAIAGRDDVGCFATIAEAESWLFAEEAVAIPRRIASR